MKFYIAYSGENTVNMMRRVGYFFLQEGINELSFVRPLQGRDKYPRFHVYLNLETDSESKIITFNLHLDQKKPSYSGTPAHGGEYGGKILEKEADRIKQILTRS